MKKISVDETKDFENVVNENFASLKTIFLMFLNDRSRRLKAFESEKIEKKLKTCLFELSDDENFVDETLMMKWEIAAWESFDSWIENQSNRFSFDRSKNELSNENDVEKKASQMNVKILNLNNDSVVEMKINNEMMKEECAAVKTDEKVMKEDWKFCAWKRCRYFSRCLTFYVCRNNWVLIKKELNKLFEALRFARSDIMSLM